MNKEKAQELLDEFKKEFGRFESIYGVCFRVDKASYSNNSISVKIEGIEANKSEAERIEFEKNCRRFGFAKEMYGKEFVDHNGRKVRFVGFLPRNRKYSCIIQDVDDGTKYSCSTDYVKSNLLDVSHN